MSGTISEDAHRFKASLTLTVGSVAAFWGIIGMYLVLLALVTFDVLHGGDLVQRNGIPFVMFLAVGFLLVLSLFPGKAMVMAPYAVTLERGRGIWVCGPPKVWIPLDEITDVATYTTWLGRLHVIKLRRPHGLVRRVFLYALVSPDQLANQLRSLLDCPNEIQPAKHPRLAPE